MSSQSNKIPPQDLWILEAITSFLEQNPNASERELKEYASRYNIPQDLVINYCHNRNEISSNDSSSNQDKVNHGPNQNRTKLNNPLNNDWSKVFEPNSPYNLGLNDISFQKKTNTSETSNPTSPLTPKTNGPFFTYSSTIKKDIADPKEVPSLISQMKREHKIESRLNVAQNFPRLSPGCYKRFIQLKGLEILSDWVKDCKETFESSDRPENEIKINELMIKILELCDKLPISVNDLKISKIGKQINKFGKLFHEGSIKTKCEDLVKKWKRMIELLKEENNQKEYSSSYKKESKDERKASPSDYLPSTSTSYFSPHNASSHNNVPTLHKKIKRDPSPPLQEKNKKYIPISYLILMLITLLHNKLVLSLNASNNFFIFRLY